MSRLSRTRASRAIVTVVVSGIVIGAFVEFQRTRKSVPAASASAAKPTTQPAKPAVAAGPGPLVTRTLGTTTPPAGPLPLYASGNALGTAQPAAATLEPTPTAVTGARVLADAQAKVNANDLLTARKLLNDALLAGNLNDADAAAVKKQLADVNNVLLFSGRVFATDPLGGTYKVGPGERLSTIAKQHAIPFELLMQLNHLTDPKKLRAGQTLKVINGPFDAVVTKHAFTLDLYLGAPGGPGSTFVASYPVGLGENDSTPTGMWEIKNKAPSPTYYSPRNEGIIAAGDPKNPLGPYWLGLEGTDGAAVGAQSYGIHGTIDPTSIGKMSSMGCIRLRNEDVTVVYKLLVEKKSKVKVED